jgi:acylglycerol lipase
VNRSKLLLGILAWIGVLHLVACSAPGVSLDEPQAPALNMAQAFTTDDGVRLPIRTYATAQPPQAVVLALHGFNDHGRAFEDIAQYFAQAGIKTIAYDQRGFGGAPDRGQWAGTQVMVQDFLAILRTVRRNHPDQRLFVLGESMGAAVIAVALAQETDLRIDGVLLTAPAIWSRDTMPWYQRFGIWVGAGLVPTMVLSSSRFGIVPSDNAAMLEAFAQDPLVIRGTRLDTLEGLSDLMDQAIVSLPRLRQRTLVAYGLRDVMIPRRPMIAMLERWPQDAAQNFRFGLYPDGYHMILRDVQRAVVWRDMVSWMLNPDASLPSGFERERPEVLRQLQMSGD